DFNVRNYRQFVEKLRYIHRNPVKRGLCERPEDWEWSSFHQYAMGREGRVQIETEWSARRRERAEGRLCPAVELPHSSQKPVSSPNTCFTVCLDTSFTFLSCEFSPISS